MNAKIIERGSSFLLQYDYFKKDWTRFLIDRGAVYNVHSEMWTVRMKHLDEVIDRLKDMGTTIQTNKEVSEKDNITIDETLDKMKVELRDYQRISATLMANKKAFGLFDDCGLGKTPSTIGASIGIMDDGDRILVVAEIRALEQWKSEIYRFSGIESTVIRGTKKKRSKLWKESEEHPFTIINYHLLQNDWNMVGNVHWKVIVFDEASRYLRNRTTKMASFCRQIDAEYKWALTASPLENNLGDVFSIYEILDENILGEWFTFQRRYIQTKDVVIGRYKTKNGWVNKTITKVIGYKHQEEVKEKISEHFLRRTVDDVQGELPEVIRQTIWVELTRHQRAIYDELEGIVKKKAEMEVGDIAGLGEMIRMRRVCDSLALSGDCDDDVSSKFDELMSIIYENRHRKIIIFSQWTDPLFLLEKRFDDVGYEYSRIYGKKQKIDYEDEIRRFKERTNILLSSDAGSRSLNLQVASIIINLDMPWNPQTIKQRIGRAVRIGSIHSTVVVYDMVCKDTIEEAIIPVLNKKLKAMENFIDNNVYNLDTVQSITTWLNSKYRRQHK
jgi:SNF2 family DNA or RNA helicase